MKRKMLVTVLCAAMTASMLAGCGSTSSNNDAASGSSATGTEAGAPASSDETITLTVWAAEEDQDFTKGLIQKFEDAHPDQKFDISVGVESESKAKDDILVDVEAAADVYSFASDQIEALVDAGALQAVNDVDTVTNENIATSVEAATVDGTLYAYPESADNGYFLFYDKSVVSEEAAQTVDGILEACGTVGKKFGMVYASGWYNASFFYGAGFTTSKADDGSTVMDWNKSAGNYAGTDVAQAMLDIATNSAFVAVTDGDTSNQINSGEIAAIVSGTWDAVSAKEAFGDNYVATKLPTYTCKGEQVQMGSAAGFKMIGVNPHSEYVGWAMELALFLTNEESQAARFTEREVGPSNSVVAKSDEVLANEAIAAVTAQNEVGGVIQEVGDNYWESAKSFGEILAQGNPDGTDLQTLLDNLVEAAAQPAQ